MWLEASSVRLSRLELDFGGPSPTLKKLLKFYHRQPRRARKEEYNNNHDKTGKTLKLSSRTVASVHFNLGGVPPSPAGVENFDMCELWKSQCILFILPLILPHRLRHCSQLLFSLCWRLLPTLFRPVSVSFPTQHTFAIHPSNQPSISGSSWLFFPFSVLFLFLFWQPQLLWLCHWAKDRRNSLCCVVV